MKKMIVIILAILFLCTLCVTVSAKEDEQTTPDIIVPKQFLSEYEKDKQIRKLGLKVVDYKSELCEDKWIVSIDISHNELIAVLFNNQTILITDKYFDVKTAITFNKDFGKKYYLNWNGENLELFTSRDRLVYTIDGNGKCIDIAIAKYKGVSLSGITDRTSDKVNGSVYKLKRSSWIMFLAGQEYDELVRIDPTGDEHMLFKPQKTIPILGILFVIFFFGGHALMVMGIITSIIVRKKVIKGFNKEFGTQSFQ